jgi:hypothetical protein
VEANASTDSLKRKALLEWQLLKGEANQITPTELTGQASPFTSIEKTDQPKSRPRNNRSHISMSDVDAKLTEKRGKPSRLYYLSSMAVDTYRHVITHMQADLADERDSCAFNNNSRQAKKHTQRLWPASSMLISRWRLRVGGERTCDECASAPCFFRSQKGERLHFFTE